MKQFSKVENFKAFSDLNTAKNEISVCSFLNELCEQEHVSSTDLANISRLVYHHDDKKDIWLGFELGGGAITKQLYEIKGEF